jgi:hypothetical protein
MATKLDAWGNPLNLEDCTESELKKLREDIIHDGINKRAYSSAEESENSNSDNELLMKFVPKKSKKNGKIDFDSVAYAFSLNIKLSKTRSELARTEERLRYLQLDYNNKEVKISQQKEIIIKYQGEIKNYYEKNKKTQLIINDYNFYNIIINIALFISIVGNFVLYLK